MNQNPINDLKDILTNMKSALTIITEAKVAKCSLRPQGIKRRASNKVSQDIINQISKCFYEGKSIMTTHKELQLPFKTVRHIREQLSLRK